MKEKQKYERRYLGVTVTAENYREILEKEGRDGVNYHTKHLKAYLQGKTFFRHKWIRDEKGRVITDAFGNPRYNEYPVQAELLKINLESTE